MKKIAICVFDNNKEIYRKNIDIKVTKPVSAQENKKVKKLTTASDLNRLLPELIKGGITKEVVEQILKAVADERQSTKTK